MTDTLDIPNEYVDHNESFDPTTTDVIFAHQLENGMIVLAEERISIGAGGEEYSNKVNRWCRVTNCSFSNEGFLYFIGVYADGTKFTRNGHVYAGWHVMIDSIIHHEESDEE